MSGVRGARLVAAGVVPAELALGICLLAGVRIPAAVLIGAEGAVLAALVLEAVVLGRLWRAGRRAGAGRREAMGAALRTVVPEGVRRLVGHEMRALHSLGLWVLRRRHAVPEGALAAPYTGPQTAMMYGLLFVSVVETVMFALLIPWPVVHRILLVVDGYGVLLVLALHASCVVRPHVVGADGSLRIRYGALFDLRVPAAAIASVRVERRYPGGKSMRLHPDGVLDLAVGSQTTVTVELTAPAGFARPLGGRGQAHTVRFHADDPRSVVAALTPVRTAPSPSRDLPA
ncbi:hypothetical protein P8A22_27795 [Streptomyces laculatispora]|uniref:Integral membrane protein n=1 Tax=Streptomyces laculatispora TaxID=887464 RepID=A0ABY9I9T8_9ACTN|nr:hypothetical protein [Streptomyces laculatispora]WLQ43384.1 hypothetical protein P8A22_27795 [Streptomyces laculatispora]